MREIEVCPPQDRYPFGVVRRLQFTPDGTALIATLGHELHAYNLRTDRTRVLFDGERLEGWSYWHGWHREPEILLSPDRRLVVCEDRGDVFDEDTCEAQVVYFEDLTGRSWKREYPPRLATGGLDGTSALVFSPDGTELIAVRNRYDDGTYVREVVRFSMSALTALRFEDRTDPLSRQPYKFPVLKGVWRAVMPLPGSDTDTAALSDDGRLLAVGGASKTVCVADLKRKKVVTSLSWTKRRVRHSGVRRLGFDPAAERVVILADGWLFARPLGAGKPWRTTDALGYAHDFAYHLSGNTLVAVFRDGEARYLDPLTGKVRESFKWSKKPKPLYSVAFAPDGLTCAAGGENGKVVVWDVDG